MMSCLLMSAKPGVRFEQSTREKLQRSDTLLVSPEKHVAKLTLIAMITIMAMITVIAMIVVVPVIVAIAATKPTPTII